MPEGHTPFPHLGRGGAPGVTRCRGREGTSAYGRGRRAVTVTRRAHLRKSARKPPPCPQGFIPEQGTQHSGEPRGLQPSHAREETSIVWKQLLTARPVRVCAGGRGERAKVLQTRRQGAPGRVPGAPRARSWRRAAGEGRGTVPPPEQSAGGAGVSEPVFDSELDLPPGALPGFPPPEETPVSGFCGRSLARALAGPPSWLLPRASPGGPESSGGWRWALALGDSPAVGGTAALRAASAAPASPELQACDLLAI